VSDTSSRPGPGIFNAVRKLCDGPPEDAPAAFAAYANDAYNARDLRAFVSSSIAGVAYCCATASRLDDKRAHFLEQAKIIAYNLGANTWPGWDDPGVDLSPTDLAIGRDAAAFSLALVEELDLGDAQRANGLWLVAAHDLAAGDHATAKDNFGSAGAAYAAAGETASAAMSAAYGALCDACAAPADAARRGGLDAALAGFDPGDEGQKFIIDQLRTARRIFLSPDD